MSNYAILSGMKRALSEYAFYRKRHVIGVGFGLIVVALLLFGTAVYVPGGVRSAEIASAVASSDLSPRYISANAIINLPYHVLQHLSFMMFGVTIFGIKLPSLILALGVVIGLYLLLREWFRSSTALVATLIATTMPLFLYIAQDGTPLLYTIFISIWLLVSGTYTSRDKRPRLLWKTLFLVLFALNLYAPLGVYLDIALLSMTLFHPHIRHLIRKLSKAKLALGMFLGLVAIIPLIYAIITTPSIVYTLLGVPSGQISLIDNLHITASQLFNFMGGDYQGLIAPVLPVGISVLVVIGIYFFFRVKYTAQSYIISIWTLLLIPLILMNPARIPYLFVSIALILAIAINGLIRSWYNIFPNNPYAHLVALFPLGLIVSGLFASSFIQYTSAYYYSRPVVSNFSDDPNLLPQALAELDATKAHPATVLVSSKELPFYQTIAKYDKRFSATDHLAGSPERLVVTHDAYKGASLPNEKITRIITNRMSDNSDRFYTYQTIQK